MPKKTNPLNHGDRDARIRRAWERLGTENPRCLICSQKNPLRLELHHPTQHQFDDETAVLCSNHHDDASDWQKDHPQKIEGFSGIIEIVAHWLFGLGDLLNIAASEPPCAELKDLLTYIAGKLHSLGHLLIDLAQSAVTDEIRGAA
jgi:hypothetical protein